MKVRIKGTRKIVELEYRDDRGIDIINNLIGNAGAMDKFTWNDNGTYTATHETVDWWLEYISKDIRLEKHINDLSEGQGIPLSVIRDYISEAFTDDYNDHHSNAEHLLCELEELAEPLLSKANNNLLELGYTDDQVLDMTTYGEFTPQSWLRRIGWLGEETKEKIEEWRDGN
jgi:hypothetical protein